MKTFTRYFFVVLILLLIPALIITSIISIYQIKYFSRQQWDMRSSFINTASQELYNSINDAVTAFSLFANSMVPVLSIENGNMEVITASTTSLHFPGKGIDDIMLYDRAGNFIGNTNQKKSSLSLPHENNDYKPHIDIEEKEQKIILTEQILGMDGTKIGYIAAKISIDALQSQSFKTKYSKLVIAHGETRSNTEQICTTHILNYYQSDKSINICDARSNNFYGVAAIRHYVWVIVGMLVSCIILSIIVARYIAYHLQNPISLLSKLVIHCPKMNSGMYAKCLSSLLSRKDEFSDLAMEMNKSRKLSAKLEEERVRLEALAAIGSSAAMVAHDVRKPLTSMKALLTALPVIKDNPAEMAKMVTSVDRNITQVNQMLSDVLEFSKDATFLNLADEDPQGIITAALTDALRNHQGSKMKISYALNHTHLLRIDGARIIRVLVNIIDNALDAMTPKGGVAEGTLHVATCDVDQIIRITITDSGPGIPLDVLPKIFDPFVTKGKIGGTGLGLAICHKIIDMHGGKIEAGNLPHPDLPLTKGKGHKGAQFVIELPASRGTACRAPAINENELIFNSREMEIFRKEEAARPEYGDSANTAEFMRINKERGRMSYLLIVDDEPLFRETVRCLLSDIPQVKDHVKFVEADSAEVALDTMSKQEFDYVISDIDLGKNRMNGYEFSRQILEKQTTANTRVVIHSNKRKEEMDKSIRQIKNERFMGFLPKPMSQSELLQFLACKTFEVVGADLCVCPTVGEHIGSPLQNNEPKPKKKILVLNDDDTVLMMYKYVLKLPAHQVLTASNVSDAMKLYMEEGIDVILSDINLGEDQPDGYDFLKQIRERDKNVRFYFASGYSIKEHEARAMAAGANAYFQNPIEDSAFKEILGWDKMRCSLASMTLQKTS